MPPRKRARAAAAPATTVSTLAGSGGAAGGFADGAAADARFNYPADVAVDAEGNVIVADSENHCIRKIGPDGTVSTLAGSRERESGFADGAAADARFEDPLDVAVDAEGNVIVADSENRCIRKIGPDGTVSTLAGSREQEPGFADGAAADARFRGPRGIAIGFEGTVFVADCGSPMHGGLVRKLTNCGLGQGVEVPRWSIGSTTIASDWVRMLEDDEFADTTFEVEGAHISAHRSVLVVRSEYFRAMLRSGCRETQRGAIIQIGECTPTAFRKLLGFLYSDGACAVAGRTACGHMTP